MMSDSDVTTETSVQDAQNPANNPASNPASDPAAAFSTIVHLASESPTRRRYYCDALACIARAMGSPYAVLEADLSTEVINESWHMGPMDPGFWKDTVNGLLNTTLSDREAVLKIYGARKNSDADNNADSEASEDSSSQSTQVAIMTALLSNRSGSVFGVVGMVAEFHNREDAAARHAVMKSLVSLIGDCSNLSEVRSENTKSESSASDAGVISKASAYGSIEEMAIAITNNLRNRTGCDQVAMGDIRGKAIRLLSISGFDEVRSRTPGAEVIRSAMTECLDAEQAVAFPNMNNESDEGSFLLHKRWSVSVQGASVASVPLISDGKIAAILSFRRDNDEPFSVAKLTELAENMASYATAMTLVARATESAHGHLLRSGRQWLSRLLAPGQIARKCILAAALAVMAWVIFGTMEYKVTAPATVKPAEFRSFSVPFDAELTVAPLATGDRIEAGNLICEFDTRQLHNQRQQLLAQLEMAQIEANRARSEQSVSEAAIANAEANRIKALLAETDDKIRRAALTAPFSGTVIAGDFRQRVGQMLPRGEMLYSIASDQGWRVSVDIQQMYAGELKENLTGRFVANARPGAELNLRLLRVNPASVALNGKNVFTCEAALNADQQWIRSGMEGVAKIEMGRKPVWWVLSHRFVNFVRMKLWM